MKKKLLLILLLVCLVGAARILVLQHRSEDIPQTEEVFAAASPHIHPVHFYEERFFYKGIADGGKTKKIQNHIFGALVPHHLLPGFILSDIFQTLAQQTPKTILLIGPNHYEKGDFQVLTSEYAWKTPFGIVQPQMPTINQLLKKKLIAVDEAVLVDEHAVSGIMPYIAYYLPETRVVPLILSGRMTEEETRILARELATFISEDSLIVASIDFSHYLPRKLAEEKDMVTQKAMQEFDIRTILALNNDYVDSPPSLATFLETMQLIHATKYTMLHHTNSGILLRDDTVPTTSYFGSVYYK